MKEEEEESNRQSMNFFIKPWLFRAFPFRRRKKGLLRKRGRSKFKRKKKEEKRDTL